MDANTKSRHLAKSGVLAVAIAFLLVIAFALSQGFHTRAFAEDLENSQESSQAEKPSDEIGEPEEPPSDEPAPPEDEQEPEEDPDDNSDDESESESISKKVATVTVDKTDIELKAGGESETVNITFGDFDKDEIDISLSGESVVDVGAISDGGTFTVTSRDSDGSALLSIKAGGTEVAVITVTVKPKKRTVTLEVTAKMSQASIDASTDPDNSYYDGAGTTTFEFELDPTKSLSYSISANGYKDKTGSVSAGKEDVDRPITLTPKKYQIHYELKGGKNSSENPKEYTIESDTITIANPTKQDCVFEGWTYDGSSTPEKEPEIYAGSTEDKTFTAHWKKLKDGMKVVVSNTEVTYDAEEHSLKFDAQVEGKDKSKNKLDVLVRFSGDEGKTYKLKEKPYTDAGDHTIYYKVSDKDQVYKPVTGKATLKINETGIRTDARTGVQAQGDVFKKYTTNRQIVELQVEDITNNSSKKDHVAELKKRYYDSSKMSLFKVYDVKLVLVDKGNNKVKKEVLNSNFGSVQLTFPTGSAYSGCKASVYERHTVDGKVKEIPFKDIMLANDGAKVAVNSLSDFVLVVNKKEEAPKDSALSANEGNPFFPLIPIVVAVVAIAAGAVAIYQFRKQR